MKCHKRRHLMRVCTVSVENTIFMDRNTSFYRKYVPQPLKIQIGQFHTHCINIYKIIYQNEKVNKSTCPAVPELFTLYNGVECNPQLAFEEGR